MTLPQKSGSLESWDSRKLGYWVNGFLESREPGSLECWNTDEPCEGTDEGSTVSVSMTGGVCALSGPNTKPCESKLPIAVRQRAHRQRW